MKNTHIRASKFMSFVLRHRPDEIGIELDEHGWVLVTELVDKSRGRLDEKTIRQVVDTNDKKRFALSEDGRKIRASQGHSVDIELGLMASEPPELLFHGTAERFIQSIEAKGLIAGSRQHVHLSTDHETARKVGARHGKPFIITVMANLMHGDGRQFFLSENGVWLTEKVPPEYLRFHD